jgi:hypothetical protein
MGRAPVDVMHHHQLHSEGLPADLLQELPPQRLLRRFAWIEVPAKEGTAEYELDLSPLKLAPGSYSVWFRGEEKTKRTVKGKEVDATLVLCSNPVLLHMKEPPKP